MGTLRILDININWLKHIDIHNICKELEIIDIKFPGWDWPVSCNEQEEQAKIWFLSCIYMIHVTYDLF